VDVPAAGLGQGEARAEGCGAERETAIQQAAP